MLEGSSAVDESMVTGESMPVTRHAGEPVIGGTLNQAGSFADPGQGLIDFARIFRAHAVDEYIVERDDAGSPPRAPEDALDTARVGYQFLRTVRF